ncbi:MAG: RNA-guided pseudouridylation complex pseudouridine synthase subunit Cbf5 [Thermoprotei archaeon]
MGLAEKGIEFIDRITENAGYKQEWIVLREADTSPDYGFLPYKRPIEKHIINGVVNLDKPPGPTSHEVVAWVKKLFGVEKAGHGGTLDPKVTGVLPIGLANATKVIGNVVHTIKEYVMVIQLHGDVSESELKKTLEYFVGEIYQRPPLRSSVKRTIRKRRIYYIEFLEKRDRYVLVRVGCQAGTYMRKLAHDLGLLLGIGAHMRELRRTRTGPFKEDETLVKMQELSEALYMWREMGDEKYLRHVVLPVETAIAHLPKIMILDTAVDAIAHGADLAVPGIARLTTDVEAGKIVAILSLKGELVALGKALKSANEIKELNKGIVVKTWRVYMDRGIYPDFWRKK